MKPNIIAFFSGLWLAFTIIIPSHANEVYDFTGAIHSGDLELVKHFLYEDNALAYINQRDYADGYAPLHEAAEANHPEIMKLLIKEGADLNIQSKHHVTPLHIASNQNHPEIVRILIDSGANLNVVTLKNVTPLMYSSEYNHIDIVKMLLKAGADPNIVINANGATALHLAVINGHDVIIRLLLKAKADTLIAIPGYGSTALDLARNYKITDNPPESWDKIIKLLKKAEAKAKKP